MSSYLSRFKLALYRFTSRVVPGTVWMRGYAWYRLHVRRTAHALRSIDQVGARLWRLSFVDGSSIYIVSPQRLSRYLGGNGLREIYDSMLEKYGSGHFAFDDVESLIDIGANVGEFALMILDKNPRCRILCVEPDETVLPALKANLSSYPNVTIVAAALGATRGSTTFYSSWRDADSSLVPPQERSQATTTRLETLDRLMEQVGWSETSLLKMDAEGAEPEVLDGAIETLGSCRLVTIDAGPERHGRDTVEKVIERLERSGMRLLPASGHIVLAESSRPSASQR